MDAPRLLVALRPREEVGRVLRDRLADVPSQYVSEGPPDCWGAVEAILLGSVERELGNVDLRALPRLRFVQRVYTGMDGVPLDRFPPEVRFAGNVGGLAPFVAEHAVTLALAAARDLPRSHAMAVGGTLRPPPTQRLVRGRCVLILGYGEIGRAIATRLAGFDCRIVGLNRTGTMAPGVDAMFPADRLADAVVGADFVFDCRPLTRATRGTVTASLLSAMVPTAVYVNVGRAGTVHEEDLFGHLRTHPEFRAALDVWWAEEFASGRVAHRLPWAELPNLVGTPHSAGYAPGADAYALERAVDNLVRFFRGQEPQHLLDRTEYE